MFTQRSVPQTPGLAGPSAIPKSGSPDATRERNSTWVLELDRREVRPNGGAVGNGKSCEPEIAEDNLEADLDGWRAGFAEHFPVSVRE